MICLALLLGIAAQAEEAPTAQPLVGTTVAIPVVQSDDAAQVLTALEITGLDKPVVSEKLDDEAEIVSAEGIRWTIPVLWVNSKGRPIQWAAAGFSPMPVLLFVMPEGCRAALNPDGLAEITLPEYLVRTFGDGILTLAVEAQRVTYMTGLNIAVDRLAERKRGRVLQPIQTLAPAMEAAPEQPAAEPTARPTSKPAAEPAARPTSKPAAEPTAEPTTEPTVEPTAVPDYVSLYASKTARDAVEADELAHVIDILVNNVQPQAVNLLREKCPAFHEAAEDGKISTRIGLYVYYQRGDEMLTAEAIEEYALAAAARERAEKLEGVDWASLEKEKVVRRMLDTFYPSNILAMVEAIEGRDDLIPILGEVADSSVTHMRLSWDHDIEYEEDDWGWDDAEIPDDEEDGGSPDVPSDAEGDAAEPVEADAAEDAVDQEPVDEAADEQDAALTEEAETADVVEADAGEGAAQPSAEAGEEGNAEEAPASDDAISEDASEEAAPIGKPVEDAVPADGVEEEVPAA